LYLATTAPVIVAPAMNVNMWNHSATQENLERLRARGVHIVNPDEGYLACGMSGAGRLAGQDAIVAAVREVLQFRLDLAGHTVLLTAGPTQEDLDPVRFLTNRSSGRMGYAVAEAAAQRGAKVILISGPTVLEAPTGITRVDVRTASEMLSAVNQHFAEATTAIFAAAVADYRPVEVASQKIKKTGGEITVRLEPNPDILATIARKKGNRIVVGFAAETERVAENARKKLKEKDADLVVANDVTAEGAGFDVDTNVVTLLARDGRDLALPKMSKRDVAHRILDEVVRLSASVKHQSAD
jgi:phosphopantothenoylcysteine decarboxylase/phosphopantothenate--cysteine ligase